MSLCQHGVQIGNGYECSACVTTITAPHMVAALDQELAELNAILDHMVRHYRSVVSDRGEHQTVADFAATVGATYPHDVQAGLCAAAVRRLAAAEGAQ